MDDELSERLVVPFYLDLMRTNSLQCSDDLFRAVVKAGLAASADEVVQLLRDPWRATVMGAWFSLLQDERLVLQEVCNALSSSADSLTSPPLAVAAVELGSTQALPVLRSFCSDHPQDESCGFVAAAIEHFGERCGSCGVSDDDREEFDQMLAFGQRLRAERRP